MHAKRRKKRDGPPSKLRDGWLLLTNQACLFIIIYNINKL
jgi:hypothetical protein